MAKRFDKTRCHLVNGGTPRPRRHCIRWGPSSPQKGAHQPPLFGPFLLWPNGRPFQLLLSSCYFYSWKNYDFYRFYFRFDRRPTDQLRIDEFGFTFVDSKNIFGKITAKTIAILFIFSTAKDIETLPQNIAIATSIGFIGIANNPACCMVP